MADNADNLQPQKQTKIASRRLGNYLITIIAYVKQFYYFIDYGDFVK